MFVQKFLIISHPSFEHPMDAQLCAKLLSNAYLTRSNRCAPVVGVHLVHKKRSDRVGQGVDPIHPYPPGGDARCRGEVRGGEVAHRLRRL